MPRPRSADAPRASSAFSRGLRLARTLASGAALAALTIGPRRAAAQPTGRPSEADLVHAARAIAAAAKYAVFVTLDSTGHPQTRTVQPVDPDSLMIVRFATNPRSRKVAEIERDGRASLHYFDPMSPGYVTFYGRARLIRSVAEKTRYWNPAWTPFYADRDTSVVLVELIPERLELVDSKRGITSDPVTWRAPTLAFPLGRPALR